MGLDITAYSNLRYIGRHPGDQDEEHGYDPKTYETIHAEGYAYNSFPHALVGPYKVERSAEFISVGCFEVTEKTETHKFRAGSYHGYGEWRRGLRTAFNPDADPDLPFFELICFADNEGTLLTQASRELLGDFEAHRDRWTDHLLTRYVNTTECLFFSSLYEDWTHAFKLAAECGLVDFH